MATYSLTWDTTTGKITAQPLPAGVLASGAVQSGNIGNAAVVSGSIASGQIGGFHIGSGQLISASYGSGSIGGAHIASGEKLAYPTMKAVIISGSVTAGELAGALFANQGHLVPANPAGIGEMDYYANAFIQSAAGKHIQSGSAIALVLDGAAAGGLGVGDFFIYDSPPRPANSSFAFNIVMRGFSGAMLIPGALISTAALDLTSGILTAAVITSSNLRSGLAHHIEGFITSTDGGGIWSAAWKAAFGTSPAVSVTPLVASGLNSGNVRFGALLNVTTALVNGGTYEPGGLAGNVFAAGSGAVHILAHDPTA